MDLTGSSIIHGVVYTLFTMGSFAISASVELLTNGEGLLASFLGTSICNLEKAAFWYGTPLALSLGVIVICHLSIVLRAYEITFVHWLE
jgi:hypothetical protein